MARDIRVQARQAIVLMMRQYAPLTALIPAVRIFPEQPPSAPQWPFTLHGAFTFVPKRAACVDGSTLTGRVHVFAKDSDDCSTATAIVAELLDEKSLPLPTLPGCYARCEVGSSDVIPDSGAGENGFHGIVACLITVSAPTL